MMEFKPCGCIFCAEQFTALQAELQQAREEIERLKKDPLCQALTNPDCCCHSCLKDQAIEDSIALQRRLDEAVGFLVRWQMGNRGEESSVSFPKTETAAFLAAQRKGEE
jgi:hypothetical protein